MRRLRHREVILPAEGHTADNGQVRGGHSEAMLLALALHNDMLLIKGQSYEVPRPLLRSSEKPGRSSVSVALGVED